MYGKDSNYAFSFQEDASGNNSVIQDCLTSQLGAAFSTYDSDNDEEVARHCAVEFGGGWWFRGSSCSACNPTGPVLFPYNGSRHNVVGKMSWSGYDLSPIPLVAYLINND